MSVVSNEQGFSAILSSLSTRVDSQIAVATTNTLNNIKAGENISITTDGVDNSITINSTATGTLPAGAHLGDYLSWRPTTSEFLPASSASFVGNPVRFGNNAGPNITSTGVIAIGDGTGATSQQIDSMAIGTNAGKQQGRSTIAIGNSAAGGGAQGDYSIAIGNLAGSGTTGQGSDCIAIGASAGFTSQSSRAVAIGNNSGYTSQGNNSVAIGQNAGHTSQGQNAVALGNGAGKTSQGQGAFALGAGAGGSKQGNYAIAIGELAGTTNQAANSIIINATGAALENTTANSFVMKPVRNTGTSGGTALTLRWNSVTGEIFAADS